MSNDASSKDERSESASSEVLCRALRECATQMHKDAADAWHADEVDEWHKLFHEAALLDEAASILEKRAA